LHVAFEKSSDQLLKRYTITITGIVQGVGFRPFIYQLAQRHGLQGWVCNDAEGVQIEVQGRAAALQQFITAIRREAPPKSRIDSLDPRSLPLQPELTTFHIAGSKDGQSRTAQVSPDLDVCNDCLRELFDPQDRRYLYPFINCTNCGPRFSIIADIPYDRPATTMAEFKMCERCRAEYENPMDRRFHAQPNACPDCGPRVELCQPNGELILRGGSADENQQIFKRIGSLLEEGKILAVKGLGGFHLACDARNDPAVQRLRKRKFREDKPFAVMFPDLDAVKVCCRVSPHEQQLISAGEKPIVLLHKREDCQLAEAVAPGNHYLGAMLPYTPLHALLMHFYPAPLVMTSGNVSDEPIVTTNGDALERLHKIADVFLLHNRKIFRRCDDSVVRIWQEREYPIRRSRGYAPRAIRLERGASETILACGPEQKNSFGFMIQDRVYLSQHIGDMENYQTLHSFETEIERYKRLFAVEPGVVAYDLHPDYLSTKYALHYPQKNRYGETIRKIGVQHHHAHAAACMAENGLDHPVLAITLDGTGYGSDGTIWGGEILLAEYRSFRRLGCLRPVAMPGGAAAIRNPWQMAYSYLHTVFGAQTDRLKLPFLEAIPDSQDSMVAGLLALNPQPLTSSCGRLFDAFAAIAGVRNRVNYEGQAAVEFEQRIPSSQAGEGYPFRLVDGTETFQMDWREAIQTVVSNVKAGVGIGEIAYRFHEGLAQILAAATIHAAEMTNIQEVVCSGGVFMNQFLLSRLDKLLENAGFSVYTHREVPANDGGVALGQAVIAAALSQDYQE